MKNYVLAIDQGTTSSRAIIFNKKSEIVAKAQMEFSQICPNNGWVEHNPDEIWETTYEVIRESLFKSGLSLRDIAAIGITNQRETTILWDKKTGEPVYNAICWQSRQSQDICEKLIADGYEDLIHKKTGLIINPYFSLILTSELPLIKTSHGASTMICSLKIRGFVKSGSKLIKFIKSSSMFGVPL